MKICIISASDVLALNEGGMVRTFELAKNLNACGASVYVIHHGATKSLNPDFKFINFKSNSSLQDASNYLHPINIHFSTFLKSFINKYSPDIIQCEGPWSAFPTMFIAKQFGIPCILDEHNVEFLWTLNASRVPLMAPISFVLEKVGLSLSSFILVTSNVDRTQLMKMYGIPEGKICVIPNGVNTKRYLRETSSKSQIKESLGYNRLSRFAIFHGVLSAKQNYEAALLIVDNIAPKVSEVTFVIAGKNPPIELRKKAKTQKNVVILGFVQNIEEYIMAADFCIVPIRRGSGTRLKILEYMAAGKPIISTNIGSEGIPLKSGKNAILCKDVNFEFIDSIQYVLSNTLAAERMGNKAKELSEKFSWESIGKSLYNFYQSEFIENTDNR